MRTLIMLFLLLAVEFPHSYGQKVSRKPETSTKERGLDVAPSAKLAGADELDKIAIEIKRTRSVATEALNCDKQVIRNVLPEIESKFAQRGFTAQESFDASSESWIDIRFYSPLQTDKCMNQKSYLDYVTDLGHLNFRTAPDHADIELELKNLNKTTTYGKWYEPKTYNVKYTKDGYEPFERQCTVLKGQRTDCYAELKKKP